MYTKRIDQVTRWANPKSKHGGLTYLDYLERMSEDFKTSGRRKVQIKSKKIPSRGKVVSLFADQFVYGPKCGCFCCIRFSANLKGRQRVRRQQKRKT